MRVPLGQKFVSTRFANVNTKPNLESIPRKDSTLEVTIKTSGYFGKRPPSRFANRRVLSHSLAYLPVPYWLRLDKNICLHFFRCVPDLIKKIKI